MGVSSTETWPRHEPVAEEPTDLPQTGVVYDSIYKEHCPGPKHPESPERCDAAMAGVQAAAPPERLTAIAPRRATEDELALCHDPAYIETVKRDVLDEVHCLSTGDTDLSERSLDVALMAVGGVLNAVDAVMAGQVRNAFCCVRPPGHHATPDRGMGFCIFNNVAVAARYAQEAYGIRRVLIVDWDVHHGNGTQDTFWEDPSVFYFSTHQWPCYPGTGTAGQVGHRAGKGTTRNSPLPSGSGRREILGAVEEKLIPAMRMFEPEFVFISAGFDGRAGDPIGNFVLSDHDFADLTSRVMTLAAEYADERLVSVLEGGYEMSGLASAVGAHVARLAGVGDSIG